MTELGDAEKQQVRRWADNRAENSHLMGWTPPTASMCHSGGVEAPLKEASVSEVTTIGLDIAKSVFHVHGADERGAMLFSRKLTRSKLLEFFAGQPRCIVALEACGGAHH